MDELIALHEAMLVRTEVEIRCLRRQNQELKDILEKTNRHFINDAKTLCSKLSSTYGKEVQP